MFFSPFLSFSVEGYFRSFRDVIVVTQDSRDEEKILSERKHVNDISFIHSFERFAVSGHRPWTGLIPLVGTVISCRAAVRSHFFGPVGLHVDVIALPQCPLSREIAF